MKIYDEGHEATEALLRDVEREVSGIYAEAAIDAQTKLKRYLEGFERRDAIKKELVKAGKLSQEEYARWRYGQICMGNRWQDMADSLAMDFTNADKIAMSIVNEYTPEAYAVNANYATYQIEHGLGIDTSWTLYDRGTVERLIRDKPDLYPQPSVNIPKDFRWNRQYINNAVTQAVLQGEDIKTLSKRIFPEIMSKTDLTGKTKQEQESIVRRNKQAAMRNARTSMNSAQNAGRMESYQRAVDLGIKGKVEWVSAHDGKTRESHIDVDGEQIDPGGTFSNGLAYPCDPGGPPEEVYNCRCTTEWKSAILGEVKDDPNHKPSERELELMEYREDKAAHKMSFEEWQKARGERAPDQTKDNPFNTNATALSESEYLTWQETHSTRSVLSDSFEEKYGVSLYQADSKDEWIESERKWLSDIAKEQTDLLWQVEGGLGHCGYIQDADGSRAINAYLRKDEVGIYSKREMQTTIDAMEALISSTKLDKDMIVDRCAGIDALKFMGIDVGDYGTTYRIGHAFCTDGLDVSGIVDKINSDFVGAVLRDDGFMSASVSAANNVFGGSDVAFTILAPEGTHAFVSDNTRESEIVFNHGTEQRIVGARVSSREATNYDGEKIERQVIEIFLEII